MIIFARDNILCEITAQISRVLKSRMIKPQNQPKHIQYSWRFVCTIYTNLSFVHNIKCN